MKLAILGAAFLLGACVKTPAPMVAGPAVTTDDCTRVYSRWLSIGAVVEYGADPESQIEMSAAIKILGEAKREDGAEARFYNSCTRTMNTAQAACMMHAETFNQLHTCARMYTNK